MFYEVSILINILIKTSGVRLMEKRLDEYLKKYSKQGDPHRSETTHSERRSKRKRHKKPKKMKRSVLRHRRKCKLCGASIDPLSGIPICKNCQISLFQIKTLKNTLRESIMHKEKPPEWALKAANKITEILSNYPEFLAYKNVVSEVVWEYIIDDEAQIEGIEIEDLVSLKYTYKNKTEILQELYKLGIVDITNDRKLLPGKLLQSLLEIKKVYGDNFRSVNWEMYTSAIQAIFMLDITEKHVDAYLSGHKKKNLKQVLTIFKILSRVIEDNLDKTVYPEIFSIAQVDFDLLLSLLGDKKTKLKFYVNITGIVDGKSKLVEDFDEEAHEFKLHKDFNEYIIRMIERIREIERERS